MVETIWHQIYRKENHANKCAWLCFTHIHISLAHFFPSYKGFFKDYHCSTGEKKSEGWRFRRPKLSENNKVMQRDLDFFF